MRSETKRRVFKYNQAILIEFEDFALSKAIDLAMM